MAGFLAHSSICFEYEWGKVAVWVSASFVVFSAAGGVVGSWGGVGGGGVFGHWVGYGYVDVGCCVFVGGNDIHDGSFELWWIVDVAVEFWEVYFELGE